MTTEVTQKLMPLMEGSYSISKLARWVKARYDNYLDREIQRLKNT